MTALPATATATAPTATGPGVRGHRLPADAGSATIWVLCCCLLVWSAGLAGLTRGAAVVARHRAESAADLAALAGARVQLAATGPPCARVAEVAARNGARLVACAARGDGSLSVVLEVPGPSWGRLRLPPARARARAGGR
ncbi:MAG: hypothetical protein QOI54_53 [Actinomycetota bacterium]|nr:hypothetical protein [Actinomycetota bacterium]